MVHHGYTLTSKILFRDVIETINKYAFIKNEYVNTHLQLHTYAHICTHKCLSLIATVFVPSLCWINPVVSEYLCLFVTCLYTYILTFGPLKGPNCVFIEKLQGALLLRLVLKQPLTSMHLSSFRTTNQNRASLFHPKILMSVKLNKNGLSLNWTTFCV